MRSLGSKAFVYHGDICLGEVNAIPVKDVDFQFPANVIRIHHILPNSKRCHPISVFQTISSSLLCKLQPINSSVHQTQLMNLHSSCFSERKGSIKHEKDPIKISRILAEMQRYKEDHALLREYMDNDSVFDNGKVYKVQPEEATPLGDGHVQVVRPIIRLPQKNTVLTRINPKNRDTSVLVRLRDGWEDMRKYLTAKGRRRFEVYVCTKAQRDYAMEIWRLLDPEAELIKKNQLTERLVCVKSGAKKCLLDVFKDGSCDSNLSMVIDDRLDVWEEKDHSRVHVVPPFTPYSAPQAEIAGVVPIPVLRVARNVACNFRLEFFRDFDINLSRKFLLVVYEDKAVNLPSAPDVSSYLYSQDISFAPNENVKPPCAEGTNGPKDVSLPNIIGAVSIREETPSITQLNPEPISLEQDVNLSEVDPNMNRGFQSSINEANIEIDDRRNTTSLSPANQLPAKELGNQGRSFLEDMQIMSEEFSLEENNMKMDQGLAFLEHVRNLTRIEEVALQNATKMKEGVSIKEHVVKMVNNFTSARIQRDKIELAGQISMILGSLPDCYSQFKFDSVKNLDEFMEKLQMAEIMIKSKGEAGSSSFGPQGQGHGQNKRKGKLSDSGQNSKKQKKKGLLEKKNNERNFNGVTRSKCFICGEKGHLKQHCPKVDLDLGCACASCNSG